jgi:hypothetical protein
MYLGRAGVSGKEGWTSSLTYQALVGLATAHSALSFTAAK